MSNISVITMAVTMAVAFAPGACPEPPLCTDYFDCGYTMPAHLIINPTSGATASGNGVVEPTPFDQGPPTYNDWRRTQGAVE